MIEQKIRNLAFKLSAAFDRDPGKFELSTGRDWALTAALFAAAVIAAAAWNSYLYLGISRDEAFSLGAGVAQPGEEITREKVEQAYEYFREKDSRFESVRSNRTPVADPSR